MSNRITIHHMQKCSSWIDYFEIHPEGPTIILHSDDVGVAKVLVRIFSALADGRIDGVNLGTELPVAFSPRINSLALRATLDTRQPRKTVIFLAMDSEGAIFEWRQSRASWESSANQLLPIQRVSSPNHRPFGQEFGSDAQIIVSINEYLPRNLEDVHITFANKRASRRHPR
jgi:hypothetical protein